VTNFWKDEWVPVVGKLTNSTLFEFSDIEKLINVTNFVLWNDLWDCDQLRNVLPGAIIQRIMKISVPRLDGGEDVVCWKKSHDGRFHSKDTYLSLLDIGNRMNHCVFKLIWSL